jgi:Transglutaminase-like superfamily
MASSSFRRSDLRALVALSRPERRLLAQALLVLPVIRLVLRLRGYHRSKQALGNLVQLVAMPADPLLEATMVDRMVRVAAGRGPLASNCLSRSLTLWVLLRQHGIDAEVCLGVRRGAGDLDGHAWVEYLGRTLNDSADVRGRFALMHRPGPWA